MNCRSRSVGCLEQLLCKYMYMSEISKFSKILTKLSGFVHVNAAEKQTLLHRFMSRSMVHEM